jgi:hypothetical protein
MQHRFLAAAAASLFFAGAAVAQPRPPAGDGPPGMRLFVSPSGEPFRGVDGLADWFLAADADRDGVLTLAEFRADAMRFFKVLDADGDGWIDGFENSAYEREIAPEITSFGAGPGGRPGGGCPPSGRPSRTKGKGGGPRQGAARFSLLNEPQPVRGADLDLSQRVSAEEWAKTAGRRFARLDLDGSGKLTLAALRPRLPGQVR